jgi:hypothetical protein
MNPASSLVELSMAGGRRNRRILPAVKRRARRYGRKLIRQLQSKLLLPPSGAEARLIKELREELSGLEPLPAPAAGLENVWLEYRRQFRRLFAERDPRAFLKWELTRRALYNAGPLREELRAVTALPDWTARWRYAVRESSVGRPDRCPEWPETSWNLVHHAFALSHFERTAGRRVDKFGLIVEFGGGYGSMARLMWQLGFRGHYVVYDLPEMSVVQRYYLKSLGLPASTAKAAHDGPRVSWANSPDELARLTGERVADLFLATWSLSETQIAFREPFLQSVRADHFFLGYEDQYRGVDNARFFAEWQERRREFEWTRWPSPHEPGVSYLVGARSGGVPA